MVPLTAPRFSGWLGRTTVVYDERDDCDIRLLACALLHHQSSQVRRREGEKRPAIHLHRRATDAVN